MISAGSKSSLSNLIFQNSSTDQQASAVDSGGAGDVRTPPEFGGSEKGQNLISAYRSLAITTNTPGLKKLSTALRGTVM